jgi:hypothetical protein
MEMTVLFQRARRISRMASSARQCSMVGWNWRNGIQLFSKVSAGRLMELRNAQ